MLVMSCGTQFDHREIAAIVAARDSAEYGSRAAVDAALAARYGCHPTTIRRAYLVGTGAATAPRKKRNSKATDYSAFVAAAMEFDSIFPLMGSRRKQNVRRYEYAAGQGVKPQPSLTHFNLLLRTKFSGPVDPKMELTAEYPMQIVQVDSTNKKRLLVEGDGPNRRIVLASPNTADYDKPGAPGLLPKTKNSDRLGVGYVVLSDLASGACDIRAKLWTGENAQDVHDAIFDMLGDDTTPVRGLPDELWSDNGTWKQSPDAQNQLAKLGVTVPDVPPYSSECRGLVESVMKNLKEQFEARLYFRYNETGLTFSQFQNELKSFVATLNSRVAKQSETGETREKFFNARVNFVPVPELKLDLYISNRGNRMRTVRNGIITVEHRKYLAPKVKGIEGRKVRALKPASLDDVSHIKAIDEHGNEYICSLQKTHTIPAVNKIPQRKLTPGIGTRANAQSGLIEDIEKSGAVEQRKTTRRKAG